MKFGSTARGALLAVASIAAMTAPLAAPVAWAGPRIKDVADFEGVRENQLVGYGLVVGLAGTGDSLRNSPFTRQSLASMLERLGVNAAEGNLNTRNVAAVMVRRTCRRLRLRAPASTSPFRRSATPAASPAVNCW